MNTKNCLISPPAPKYPQLIAPLLSVGFGVVKREQHPQAHLYAPAQILQPKPLGETPSTKTNGFWCARYSCQKCPPKANISLFCTAVRTPCDRALRKTPHFQMASIFCFQLSGVFLIIIKNKENSNVKSILARSKFFSFPLTLQKIRFF